MVTPCTVFAAGAPSDESATEAAIQVDCHGVHDDAQQAEPECCCDPLAVTGGEAPKNQRVDLVAAALPAPSLMLAVAQMSSLERAHPPTRPATGLPVYLVTQRFRI